LQKSRTILLPLVTLKKIGQSVIRTFWRFFLLPCIRALFCLAILHVWLIVDTLGLKMGWGGGLEGTPYLRFIVFLLTSFFLNFPVRVLPICAFIYMCNVDDMSSLTLYCICTRRHFESTDICIRQNRTNYSKTLYTDKFFYLNGKIRLGLSLSKSFSNATLLF
jgi:hypothetical protein